MLYYFRKYPISLVIVAIICYLSFFTPPKDRYGGNTLHRQSGTYLYVRRTLFYLVTGIPEKP